MMFVTVVQFGSNPWQAKRIYNAVLKDNGTIGKCSYGMILIIFIISIDMTMLGFLFKDFSATLLFALTLMLNVMFTLTSKNSIKSWIFHKFIKIKSIKKILSRGQLFFNKGFNFLSLQFRFFFIRFSHFCNNWNCHLFFYIKTKRTYCNGECEWVQNS